MLRSFRRSRAPKCSTPPRAPYATSPAIETHGAAAMVESAAAKGLDMSSGPIVVGDVIVIAGNLDGAGDEGQNWKNSPPEDVRGFDARTGKLLWTFDVVPRGGEFGADTWGDGSGALSGDLGSWCCISADEQLGYVYIPLTAPTAAYFGGFRPGDNLFSNALVALDAKTGRRICIGLSDEDLIDFTPALRARARELAKTFVLGPIFTPPSIVSDEPGGKHGTLMVPGSWGAGNWNTGAFDPDAGLYYAFSHDIPRVYRLAKTNGADAEIAYWSPNRDAPYIDGLPIIKPPYGRIVAIDLNRGEHLWSAVNGDGPRDHPLLKDLRLPPLGTASRPTALVTGTLLFIGDGSNVFGGTHPSMWGRKFRAYDKANGTVIWEIELPAGTTSGPMTYLAKGKQYIVVPIGGRDEPAEWVALALP